MARIISIVNQKGGTGKSACTANLAVGLAQKNMKVLIVDADPQSDVSAGFGYRDCDESNETLTALMDTVMKDEDIPSDCYIRHQAEGIDIICSNIGLAGTEVQLVNAMSREYVLKQILYGIKDQYDAIIIDCMPSLGMITINALAASDEVLIPVEASYLPIKGLQQLLKTIGKVRKQINPKLQVGGILFTMVDAHTNDARNNMELLSPMLGWYAGLQYNICPNVFVSGTYSLSRLYSENNYPSANPEAYRKGQYFVANAFWNVTSNMQVGVEYLRGWRTDFSSSTRHANRLNMLVQYSF